MFRKKNIYINGIWIHVKNKKIEDEINIIFRPNFGGFLTNETNENFYNYIFKSYFEVYFNSRKSNFLFYLS